MEISELLTSNHIVYSSVVEAHLVHATSFGLCHLINHHKKEENIMWFLMTSIVHLCSGQRFNVKFGFSPESKNKSFFTIESDGNLIF
jgi:hypothetical protein